MRPSTFLSLVALSLAGFVAAAPTPQADAVALPVADSAIEARGLSKAQKEAKKKAEAKAKAAAKKAAEKKAAAKKAAEKKAAEKKKQASKPAPKPQVLAAGSGAVSTGQATFYYQNGNYGSCGKKNPDNALIVAMNTPQVAGGSHCGKFVTITNTANGKQVRAQIADECPTCSWGSLDLSVAAFDRLGSQSQGVLPIKWQFS